MAIGAFAIQSVLLATPAQAAVATWWSGKPCHGQWYNEGGASLTQTRTGQKAVGGSSGGLSQISVYFGSFGTSAWAGSAQVSGPRSYAAGRFKVDWAGGKSGECSSNSGYGQATDVNIPGGRSIDSQATQPTDAVAIGDWALTATNHPDSTLVTVAASQGEYTISADFTDSQVTAGEAQLLILPKFGDSELVSYTAESASPFSIVPAETLPTPAR